MLYEESLDPRKQVVFGIRPTKYVICLYVFIKLPRAVLLERPDCQGLSPQTLEIP